jgi:hypothetical protein
MNHNIVLGKLKAEKLILDSKTREHLNVARKYVNQYKLSFPDQAYEIQELEKLLKEQDIAIHSY